VTPKVVHRGPVTCLNVTGVGELLGTPSGWAPHCVPPARWTRRGRWLGSSPSTPRDVAAL
jgi:hypothetical protein